MTQRSSASYNGMFGQLYAFILLVLRYLNVYIVHLYIDYVLEHSRPASVCLLQLCAYLNNQRRYIIFM